MQNLINNVADQTVPKLEFNVYDSPISRNNHLNLIFRNRKYTNYVFFCSVKCSTVIKSEASRGFVK